MKELIRLYVPRSIWIIMVVCGLLATADSAYAQHEFFDANMLQKWKDYEVFSHGLQGKARVHWIRDGKPQESIYRFKQNRECALAIIPRDRNPLLLLCSLGNSHYMANLDLNKSDPSKAVLHNFTPIPGRMGTLSAFEFVFMKTSRHFFCSDKSLRQAVSDPSFKVTKVVKETQNGQERIRIDYIHNYVYHGVGSDFHKRSHGSLWLDPSQCWCIRNAKFSIETTTHGERRSEIEAEVVCETIDHPSGFPILKSVTEHFKSFQGKNKRKNELKSKIDYELEVDDKVPNSEFTLSAFGLPEPAGIEPVKKPIPTYVWLLIAAGACGAIAFAFRYLARRRRLAATA